LITPSASSFIRPADEIESTGNVDDKTSRETSRKERELTSDGQDGGGGKLGEAHFCCVKG